jgi:3-oxoacyl-[acyl-carrier protein] reductase
MARSLYRSAHRIVVVDIDRAGLDRLAAENGWSTDQNVHLHALDVRDAAGWDALMVATVARFGRLDNVFNIAGFLRPGYVHELEPAVMDLHVDVNVKGVMYATRAAARRMIDQGRGHIINVASIAGLSHVPGLSAYCASKHAVRGFSLAVAHELRRHGVAVTVVCPDAVDTPMLTLQETYPEAAMTFGGRRPLTLEEVEKALYRVLETRPLEVVLDVPLSGRALGAKLSNLFPRLTQLAIEKILRDGRANQKSRISRAG